MKTSGPDREARVLARIEAELRESDPRLPALFDRLDGVGRDPRSHQQAAGRRWRWLLAALLPIALVLTAVLTRGNSAGRQDCPAVLGCPGITAITGRALATVQAQTAEWGREIRAQLCESIPVRKTASACG